MSAEVNSLDGSQGWYRTKTKAISDQGISSRQDGIDSEEKGLDKDELEKDAGGPLHPEHRQDVQS